MRKRLIISIIIICLILVTTWFGYNYFFATSKSQIRQAYPTVVTTETAQQRQWQEKIQEIGSLSTSEGIVVAPETSGRVTQIYFKSGQYVEANTPLVQLYPDIIKAQLAKAKATLKLSTANLQRYTTLYKKGYYNIADLEKAKATVQEDQADVDNYQAKLEQTLIQAPFSGQLGLRQISLGDYLNAGDAIVNLQALDPIRVDFNVPEIYIDQIKKGDKITLTSAALSNQVYTGSIYAFDSKIDENARTLGVRARVPNEGHKLIPGTFVEVTIYLGKPVNQIIIPATAIVYQLDGNYVYLMKNHKAVKTQVTLGQKLDDNQVIITNGIKIGDTVITEGQLKLFDDSPVITEEEFQQMQKTQNSKVKSTKNIQTTQEKTQNKQSQQAETQEKAQNKQSQQIEKKK